MYSAVASQPTRQCASYAQKCVLHLAGYCKLQQQISKYLTLLSELNPLISQPKSGTC